MMYTGEGRKLLRISRSTLYRWLAEEPFGVKPWETHMTTVCDNDVYQSLIVAKEESSLLEGWNDLRELMFTYITFLKVSLTLK